MNDQRIFFRVDGSSEIGLGHVIRCLALIDILKDEFDCVFAIKAPPFSLFEQIKEKCSRVYLIDANLSYASETNHLIQEFILKDDLVVLDGYNFDSSYQKAIKNNGNTLVCIDDIHSCHFYADAIINHAGGISNFIYSKEIYSLTFLGPEFALLRRPFLEEQGKQSPLHELKKMFLNMGGADPNNSTATVLERVLEKDFITEINIVLGSAYRHKDSLKSLASDRKVKLYEDLSANDMARLMKTCQIFVCPPSTISYEISSIGGLLFLYQIAENQTSLKKFLIENNLALDFETSWGSFEGSLDLLNRANALINKQKEIFAGNNKFRLQRVFSTLNKLKALTVRDANESDKDLLFNWSNDPEVRKYSYNSNLIAYEDHCNWFYSKLNSSTTFIFIAMFGVTPIAVVRFEIDNGIALISYSISLEYRGQGFGSIILNKGAAGLLAKKTRIKEIIGFVMKDNKASIKAFERAGYMVSKKEDADYRGSIQFIKSVE